MKTTSLFFWFVCLLQVTLYADSPALRKLLDDFKYTDQGGVSIQDPDVVKLDPFPVIEEGFDDKRLRQLDVSLRHRRKLTQFEKAQRVNMFGTSFFIDDNQAYDSGEGRGGSYEIPLVSNFRNINKKIKGGIILSDNATLYLRTGVRWKIPGLPDNWEIWFPYRKGSIYGVGFRMEKERP